MREIRGRLGGRPAIRVLVVLPLLVIALVTSLVPVPAVAQDDGAALQGTLSVGEDPVPGATVRVEDEAGNEVGSAQSDEAGSWSIDLPEGDTYRVELVQETLPDDVELRGDAPGELEVGVRDGQTRTVVFQLGEDAGAAAVLLSSLQRIPQLLVNGVKLGLIIAMAAIGLSLVFGTTQLINFAHGDMVTFGAIVAWFLNAGGMHIVPAAGLAILAGAALGFVAERGMWRPLRDRRTGIVQMLVISIGLALLLRHVLLLAFGGSSQRYLDYTVQSTMRIGPIGITPRDLGIVILSLIVLVGIGLLLQRSRLGKAMRAVSDNRDLAESSGIDVRKVILAVWATGGGLAALGGVLFGLTQTVDYLMGFELLLYMFAGVILGGIGTAYGAMVGSLVVGLVTELSPLVLPTELKLVWALVVLILVLLVRPQGILGLRERVG